MREYFRPIPSLDPARTGGSARLAGGWAWFDRVEVLCRSAAPRIARLEEVPGPVLQALTAPRGSIGPLALDRPRLMGILNTTPDSFSDGGRFDAGALARARARILLAEGADIVDIGGESTRPGAQEVPTEEEIVRTAPVIASLCGNGADAPLLSLDTRKAAVAEAGLDAGAGIINDVSGLRFDPSLAALVAARGVPLIVMHSIGTPETMQADALDAYTDVLLDVYDALQATIDTAVAAGIARDRIIVDPGIGFGKTEAQNLALIRRVSLFHGLGCPILLGVSRKGFIGRIAAEPRADRRGPGSAALGLWALGQGIQVLRVHDMALHKQAIDLWQAVHAPA